MKYFMTGVLTALCIMLSVTSHAFEIPPWSASQKIYDSTGSLNKDARDALTQKSASLNSSSGLDMYFVMIDSIGKESMSSYGKAILSDWGMEDKPAVLMILAKEDHRVRIELGDGAKSKLRLDDISSANKAAIQHFRVLDFKGGVEDGFSTLTKNIVKTEKVTEAAVVPPTTAPATTATVGTPSSGNFLTSTPAIIGEGALGLVLLFVGWKVAMKKRASILQHKEEEWANTQKRVNELKSSADAQVAAFNIKASNSQADYLSKSIVDAAAR